jgi:hypothetical protein
MQAGVLRSAGAASERGQRSAVPGVHAAVV